MFRRFGTWLKGLPWLGLGYVLAAAIWSIGWGVGAATLYCHLTLDEFLSKKYTEEADWLRVKQITLLDEKDHAAGRLDRDGFVWDGGAASLSINGGGFTIRRARSGVYVTFNEDGNPSLTFLDSTGRVRLVLGSAQTTDAKTDAKRTAPVSSITLFGKDGTVIRQIE